MSTNPERLALNSESNLNDPKIQTEPALNENINYQINVETNKSKDRNKNTKLSVPSSTKNDRNSFSYNLKQPTEKFNKKKASAILPSENYENRKKTEDGIDEGKDNNTFLTAPINDKKIRKAVSERKLNGEKKSDATTKKEEKTIKEENEQEIMQRKSFLQKNSNIFLNIILV